jgi:hypothetical protein
MANFIGRLGVLLGLDSAEFQKGLAQANRQLDSFVAKATTSSLVAATALAAMVYQAMRLADEISDTAKANDIAIDSVLKLRNALALSGGEAENAGKFLSSFTASIDKAAEGSFETQKVFKNLGVSLNDLAKMNVDQLFRKTVDSLSKMDDPLTRNAKAMELFGKAAKGVDFAGLNQEIETGAGVTDEQAEAIKKAADAFDELAKSARNFSVMLATQLGPSIKLVIDYINDMKDQGDGLGKVFKIVFQTLVVLGSNVAFVFKGIADDINHTYENAVTLVTKGVAAAIAANEKYDAYVKTKRQNLDFFQAQIMGESTGRSANDPRRLDLPPAQPTDTPKRTVKPGIDKEAEAYERRLADVMAAIEKVSAQERFLRASQSASEIGKVELEAQRKVDEKKAEFTKKTSQDKLGIGKQLEQLLSKELIVIELEKQEKIKGIQRKYAINKYQFDQENADENNRLAAEQESFYQRGTADEFIRQKLASQEIDRAKEMLQLVFQGRNLRSEDLQYSIEIKELEFKRLDAIEKINANQSIANEEKIKAIERENALSEKAIELAKTRLELTKQTREGSLTDGFYKAMNSMMRDAATEFERGQQAFESVMGNMNSALDNFVKTGKLNFKSFARSVIADLIAIQLKAQAMKMFSGLGKFFSGYTEGGSKGSNLPDNIDIGGGWNPAAADGGELAANRIGLVGERGPELFVPKSAGTIIPNHAFGASNSTTNVTNNYINAIDVKSFETKLLESSNTIWAGYQYANKQLASSGRRA